MSRFIVWAVLALAGTAVSAQNTAPKYSFSGSDKEPIITMDFRGSRMKRIDDAPTLSIYADGRVVMPQTYKHSRAYSGQISQTEMQSLLDEIVGEHRFFSYDEEKVASKLAALPDGEVLPAHLSTTVITVKANNQSKSVSYYGLGNQRTVAETEDLLAIRNRLEQIMSVMKLGGYEEAGRWLALANRELHANDPQAQALQLKDLRSAAIHNDGSAYVRFARVTPALSKSVSVSISMSESGQSTIAVARDDLLSRPPNQIR